MRLYLHFLIAALAAGSLCVEAVSAGGPPVQWEKTFGGSNWDVGYSAQQTSDGGYIIAGHTWVSDAVGAGEYDVYLVKTDPNGNLQWENTFGGSSNDYGNSVRQTSDGGYIIAGQTYSFCQPGDCNVYLIKTDPNGNSQWQKTFGITYADNGTSVQQTTDGGYIITGYTNVYSAPYHSRYYDIYLIKTDASGNLTWEKNLGGDLSDVGSSIQQTTDGGFIIVGHTRSFGIGGPNVYLVKTDSSGNMSWQKIFGGSDEDTGQSVRQTTDGGYIIAAATKSFGAGNNDAYLIKTESAGNLQWEKTFGGSGYDSGWSAQQITDGSFILTGQIYSSDTGDYNDYVVKTDPSGNLLWHKSLGGSENDYGRSVQQTTDGGFIIAGYTKSFGAGEYDVYLIKLGEEGDRDGDGLLDSWETRGIDINDDNTIDLDLPALGADPNHKNLFVEVDAMVGRAPAVADFNRVAAAFAAVPNALVDNPDGNDGITLRIDLDEVNIPTAGWPNAWAGFDAVKTARFGEPTQRADPNWTSIRAAKALAYRYCVFADTHSGTTSSGLAELPGNDFMVTLGGWPTPGGEPNQQAGTFMHELGHTLGLRHGGADNIHHKPNYHSIMNYTWQCPIMLIEMGGAVVGDLNDYRNSWRLDYSQTEFPPLNEASLDEAIGIQGDPGNFVPIGPLPTILASEVGPVDCNRDGDTVDVGVSADLNRVRASQPSSPNQMLFGYNDWSNLRYPPYGGAADFQDGVHTETTIDDEMTFEIFMELSRLGYAQWDIDRDGIVNFEDLAILGDQWLQTPGSPSADIAPPVEGDNIVDLLDLAVLVEHWLEGGIP